ncbi:nitroreductase [soil metagenome]
MTNAQTSETKTGLQSFEQLARGRNSCRAYKSDTVDPSIIAQMLRTAGSSPSWCNVQPWNLTLVSGAARRELGDAMLAAFDSGKGRAPDVPFPQDYSGVYGDRRRESGFALYQALGVGREDKARRASEMRRNFDFFGAPHAIILSTPAELAPYSMLDCGVFLGSFLLAIEAAHLGAIAQASVALYSPLLHEMLAIPENDRILCAVAFGYPQDDHAANNFRTSRVAPDDLANLVETFPVTSATAN